MADRRSKPSKAMIQLKSCPRCTTGDLFTEHDSYGDNVKCLACGYTCDITRYLEERQKSRAHTPTGARQNPAASSPKRGPYQRGPTRVHKKSPAA